VEDALAIADPGPAECILSNILTAWLKREHASGSANCFARWNDRVPGFIKARNAGFQPLMEFINGRSSETAATRLCRPAPRAPR
jgi:hypothetical protein